MKLKIEAFFLIVLLIVSAFSIFAIILPTKSATVYVPMRFYISDSLYDGFVFGMSQNYDEARFTPYDYNDGDSLLPVGVDYVGDYYYVARTFLKFDTSTLPDDAEVISAKLWLYGLADYSDADFTIRIQKWTGDIPITTEDFNQFDNINYDDGNFNTANFVVDGWNSITIANLNIINRTGETKMCLRSEHDINGTEPSGAASVEFASYDYGVSAQPYLEVTVLLAITEGSGLNYVRRYFSQEYSSDFYADVNFFCPFYIGNGKTKVIEFYGLNADEEESVWAIWIYNASNSIGFNMTIKTPEFTESVDLGNYSLSWHRITVTVTWDIYAGTLFRLYIDDITVFSRASYYSSAVWERCILGSIDCDDNLNETLYSLYFDELSTSDFTESFDNQTEFLENWVIVGDCGLQSNIAISGYALQVPLTAVEQPLNVQIYPHQIYLTFGETGQLTAVAFGGSPPYTYIWVRNGSTIATNATILNINATEWGAGVWQVYCNVTDSEQTEATSNIATVYISSGALTVHVEAPATRIRGFPVTLNAIVTGGNPPYRFQWYIAEPWWDEPKYYSIQNITFIANASRYNVWLYVYDAQNQLGYYIGYFDFETPTIHLTPKVAATKIVQPAVFTCQVQPQEWYNSNYTLIWLKNETLLAYIPRFSERTYTLTYTPSITDLHQKLQIKATLSVRTPYTTFNVTDWATLHVFNVLRKQPSIVAETNVKPIGPPTQKSSFSFLDCFWQFYFNGTHIRYKFSLDAQKWIEPAHSPLTRVVFKHPYVQYNYNDENRSVPFSLIFDNETEILHLAYIYTGENLENYLYYVNATFNRETWDWTWATPQLVYTASYNGFLKCPIITLTESKKPVMMFTEFFEAYPHDIFCYRISYYNGSLWNTVTFEQSSENPFWQIFPIQEKVILIPHPIPGSLPIIWYGDPYFAWIFDAETGQIIKKYPLSYVFNAKDEEVELDNAFIDDIRLTVKLRVIGNNLSPQDILKIYMDIYDGEKWHYCQPSEQYPYIMRSLDEVKYVVPIGFVQPENSSVDLNLTFTRSISSYWYFWTIGFNVTLDPSVEYNWWQNIFNETRYFGFGPIQTDWMLQNVRIGLQVEGSFFSNASVQVIVDQIYIQLLNPLYRELQRLKAVSFVEQNVNNYNFVGNSPYVHEANDGSYIYINLTSEDNGIKYPLRYFTFQQPSYSCNATSPRHYMSVSRLNAAITGKHGNYCAFVLVSYQYSYLDREIYWLPHAYPSEVPSILAKAGFWNVSWRSYYGSYFLADYTGWGVDFKLYLARLKSFEDLEAGLANWTIINTYHMECAGFYYPEGYNFSSVWNTTGLAHLRNLGTYSPTFTLDNVPLLFYVFNNTFYVLRYNGYDWTPSAIYSSPKISTWNYGEFRCVSFATQENKYKLFFFSPFIRITVKAVTTTGQEIKGIRLILNDALIYTPYDNIYDVAGIQNVRLHPSNLTVEINGTTYVFLYYLVHASPEIRYNTAYFTTEVIGDMHITVVFGVPAFPTPPTPTPETAKVYCLPLLFWIMLLVLLAFGLTLYGMRQTWLTAIPLIPVILWLLIIQPKIPVEQMPIAFLRIFTVPPWHLYMAVILTFIAAALILTREKQ